MTDYSIAFLIPNGLICETIRKCLRSLNLHYIVEDISYDVTASRAEELVRKGTKVIVSMGVSMQVLRRCTSIPVLDLTFSEHEILSAVKAALDGSSAVVHMGSQEMYHFIQKSLDSLSLPEDTIVHRDFNELSHDYDGQVIRVLQEGFDCIIGGSRTVKLAREFGLKGIAFNIDEIVVENTLLNATFIRDFQAEQEKKTQFMEATLRCSTEGLVMVDSDNAIISINVAGAEIFDENPENLVQRNFDAVLKEKQLVDVFRDHPQLHEIDNKEKIVVLNREPVSVDGKILGEVISIRRAADVERLDHRIQKNLSYSGYQAKYTFNDIIGCSYAMERTKHMARRYAKYDSTVLVTGETGTGKELFAQSIHNESPRKRGPFVAVNCSAFPETLIESELFGYEKGSFTGAAKDGKTGFFEKASGGTIFLDEISELPLNLQPKLLRVIQEREIIRVGGSKIIPIDVRVICSSNKNLLLQMENGLFKEDLYYRLSVLELKIPPLRMRKEDIKLLVSAFIQQNNRRLNTHCVGIEPGALTLLERSAWRGNIRELSNVIERAMVLSNDHDMISEENLAFVMNVDADVPRSPSVQPGHSMKAYEKALIEETLRRCGGNRAEAAKALGISQSTIWRRLKEK